MVYRFHVIEQTSLYIKIHREFFENQLRISENEIKGLNIRHKRLKNKLK